MEKQKPVVKDVVKEIQPFIMDGEVYDVYRMPSGLFVTVKVNK